MGRDGQKGRRCLALRGLQFGVGDSDPYWDIRLFGNMYGFNNTLGYANSQYRTSPLLISQKEVGQTPHWHHPLQSFCILSYVDSEVNCAFPSVIV